MLEFVTTDLRGLTQNVLVVLICGSALIWGAAPERAVALVWLVIFELAAFVYRSVLGNDTVQLMGADIFLVLVDIIAGVLWVGIALYANHNYTLWIAGLQLLVVCAHLARGLSDLISPLAYVVMLVGPGWVQLILLAIGLFRHMRRKRIYGPYRDWRISRSPAHFERVSAKAGISNSWEPNWAPSWRDDLK